MNIMQNPSQSGDDEGAEEVDVCGAAELLEEVEREERDDGVLGGVRRVVAELRVHLLAVHAHRRGGDGGLRRGERVIHI